MQRGTLTIKARFLLIVFIMALILSFLLPVQPISFVSAQDVTRVTVEGTASIKLARNEEARSLAIKNALHKAVEEVIGASILTEALLINFKLSGGLIKAIPYGKVIEKQILEEGVINIHKAGHHRPSPTYRVKMKAGVAEETTGTDPSFKLKTSLNRSNFKDGDEMQLKIKSSKDCYVSVFIIMEDEKVLRLIPNRFKTDNSLKADRSFSFPDRNDRKKGIKLKACLPEGKDVVTETIYILALKQSLAFKAANIQEGIYGLYNGQTAFMNDLVKEIISIPLNERAEELIQYQIRKNDGGMK